MLTTPFICFLILCFIVFYLLIDRIYSNSLINKIKIDGHKKCIQAHPIRHHDFIPNCSMHNLWKGKSFNVFTNNLGRRDKKIRKVSLSTSIPRIIVVGDSFTEGPQNWDETFIGKTAKKLPQYDFINAGVRGYGPSTYYLLVKSLLLNDKLKFDEVVVFIDVGDIHNEASYYQDNSDGSLGTLKEPTDQLYSFYGAVREAIRCKLFLTNKMINNVERVLINLGLYFLPTKHQGNVFDDPMSAWTYKTEEELAYYPPKGYLPLGVEGGIKKAINKMNLLNDFLQKQGIPLSIAVYPWPAQLSHDDFYSRHVAVWEKWSQSAKCKRFINLFPDFFSEKNKCSRLLPGCWYEKLFIFGDVHYNAYGNEIISRRLEQEFRVNPIEKI